MPKFFFPIYELHKCYVSVEAESKKAVMKMYEEEQDPGCIYNINYDEIITPNNHEPDLTYVRVSDYSDELLLEDILDADELNQEFPDLEVGEDGEVHYDPKVPKVVSTDEV